MHDGGRRRRGRGRGAGAGAGRGRHAERRGSRERVAAEEQAGGARGGQARGAVEPEERVGSEEGEEHGGGCGRAGLGL